MALHPAWDAIELTPSVWKERFATNPLRPDLKHARCIDGLSLEELMQLNHRVLERIKMLQAMQAHVDIMTFNLGTKVSFDTEEGRIVVTLVKYNL